MTTTPWTLTAPSLERLLLALDDDRDAAAREYGRLHERLAGLLRWWGAANPEELADRTVDRIARTLQEGKSVPRQSVGAYARGVARMIFYEARREEARRNSTFEGAIMTMAPDGGSKAMLDALDDALTELAPSDRRMLLSYYGENRADTRQQLARQLSLSPTALRVRAHRLRQRLEHLTERRVANYS